MAEDVVNIIYEDSDVLAVNKPAGIVVHPDYRHKTATLIQKILKIRPEIAGVGEDKLRPGVVHRLDKDTSGVLIIAKNQKSYNLLKKQFQQRSVKKVYIALVMGRMKNARGVIDLAIGRSRKNFMKRISIGVKNGNIRNAVTEYKVLKKFPDYTLVEIFPKTGRTHQIRSHFKAIGHPVVCDKLYGGRKSICPFGLSRHFLHASSIELSLPSGARIKLEADLPKDLQKAVEELQLADFKKM